MNTQEKDALIAMLRRSYFAVDGLWFVMLEEALGVEQAMQTDEQVWHVLPKIQAREARRILGCTGSSLDDLAACFCLKLDAEGHDYECRRESDRLVVSIHTCPWREIMVKADRMHIAGMVADHICSTETRTWAQEFSADFTVINVSCLCKGDNVCRFEFTAAPREPQ